MMLARLRLGESIDNVAIATKYQSPVKDMHGRTDVACSSIV